MTITLTPDIEQVLTEEARETGKPLEQVALERLRQDLRPPMPIRESVHSAEGERRREALSRVKSGYYASLLGPSTLSQDKAEEVEREEQHWQ